MNIGKLYSLFTESDGRLEVLVETQHVVQTYRIRIDGGAWLEVDPNGATSTYVDQFVDGQSYAVDLQVINVAGPCSQVSLTMTAGTMTWDAAAFGYLYEDAGSVSNTAVPVAPAIPAAGPTTSTPRYSLVPYAMDSWAPFLPNHPSIVYDPSFSPPDPDMTLRWLYYKSSDGEETLRLVHAPNYETPPSMKVGPDGGLHWVVARMTPLGGSYNEVTVQLHRAQPVPYGQVPEPAAVHLEYTLPSVRGLRYIDVFWNEDGEPVLVAVYFDGEATYLAVRSPQGYVVSEISGPVEGGLVHTADGVFLASGGRPI